MTTVLKGIGFIFLVFALSSATMAQTDAKAKEFTIKGKVKDAATKKPIRDAKIVLKGSDGSMIETITNRGGKYKFDENKDIDERYVKSDVSYTIIVTKEGYKEAKEEETTVGVEQSTAFGVSFLLEKK